MCSGFCEVGYRGIGSVVWSGEMRSRCRVGRGFSGQENEQGNSGVSLRCGYYC